MNLLIQFLLRLCFGLAAGMAITSSRQVTSGYFRNHMYVTLGLATLAAMVSYRAAPEVFWYAAVAALASYIGSVFWLYEKHAIGKMLLLSVVLVSWQGLAIQAENLNDLRKERINENYNLYSSETDIERNLIGEESNQQMHSKLWSVGSAAILTQISIFSSSLLLGMVMAAMLLGHWYLNSPTMELAPLRRLILALGAAVVFQAIVSVLGLWGEIEYAKEFSTQWWLFLVLRWSFGLVGVAALAWMAWETLKIPNTQSATGILYVAVIGTFVGETMALLLSAESLFPL